MKIKLLSLLFLFVAISYSQDIQWSTFQWSGHSISNKAFDRAAVLVPVKLKQASRTFWMQFDTGSDASMVYEIPFRQLNFPAQAIEVRDNFVTMGGLLGDFPFDSVRFWIRRDFGDSLNEKERYPVIGTIGQDMIVGKILILDFPKNKFCLVDSLGQIPTALLSRAHFVPLNRRNNKLFVSLQIADTISEHFFFDTGASMFPIVTTKEMWRKVTGLQGDEVDNIRIKVPSWGEEAILVGAPIKGSLKFGNLQVWNALAYFDSTGVIDFSIWPFKTDGAIGNALFYDEYTIVLDLIENRFGILRNQ